MNKLFKTQFSTAANYFEIIFKENYRFPQSIVFEGLDIFGQYFFALELARISNCMENGEDDCTCTNCKWIRENKHPAVKTISQIDSKDSGDDSKTVVSIKQAKEITKSLIQSSDFHRFFIFLDAKEGEMEEHLKSQYESWSGVNYALPSENWVPSFINERTLTEEACNSLLKSIEEAPKRTTFVFLTKNRDSLISTITSRSMIFTLPSKKFSFDYTEIYELFKKYPDIDIYDAFYISDEMQKIIKEKNRLPNELLNMTEQFLGDLLLQNPKSLKIKNDIKKVQQAQKRLSASMQAKTVFESLMLDLATF